MASQVEERFGGGVEAIMCVGESRPAYLRYDGTGGEDAVEAGLALVEASDLARWPSRMNRYGPSARAHGHPQQLKSMRLYRGLVVEKFNLEASVAVRILYGGASNRQHGGTDESSGHRRGG